MAASVLRLEKKPCGLPLLVSEVLLGDDAGSLSSLLVFTLLVFRLQTAGLQTSDRWSEGVSLYRIMSKNKSSAKTLLIVDGTYLTTAGTIREDV